MRGIPALMRMHSLALAHLDQRRIKPRIHRPLGATVCCTSRLLQHSLRTRNPTQSCASSDQVHKSDMGPGLRTLGTATAKVACVDCASVDQDAVFEVRLYKRLGQMDEIVLH